jgi:hypothetical protein
MSSKEDAKRLAEEHDVLLLTEQQQKFLSVLNANGGTMSEDQMTEQTGWSTFTYLRTRKELADQGLVKTFFCLSGLTPLGEVYCNPTPPSQE